MRTAHKATKQMAGRAPLEKIRLTDYGDHVIDETVRAEVEGVRHGLFCNHLRLEAEHVRDNSSGKIRPTTEHAAALRCVEPHYQKALRILQVRRNDPAFFREWVRQLEHKPIDSVRLFVGVQIEAAKAFDTAPPTLRWLKRVLKGRASETTIERAFKEFGGRGQAGRPRRK